MREIKYIETFEKIIDLSTEVIMLTAADTADLLRAIDTDEQRNRVLRDGVELIRQIEHFHVATKALLKASVGPACALDVTEESGQPLSEIESVDMARLPEFEKLHQAALRVNDALEFYKAVAQSKGGFA